MDTEPSPLNGGRPAPNMPLLRVSGVTLQHKTPDTLVTAVLPGLKIGWAYAWRTLIAAELVFGTTSGSGGLGWYIYENKNQIKIPNVFAALLTVILIGLAVENVIFRGIENRTVRRWGMQT